MSRTIIRPIPRIAGAAAALTTLAIACAAGIPASAATSSGPVFGPFGMTPSPAATGQPRSYFNLSLRPGQSATDSVIVTNLSDSSERLQLRVSKGVTATNSGSAYENFVRRRCTGPSCWVSDLPHILVLAPKERRLVGFAVKVPRGIRPGQYLSGITLLAAKKPKSVRVSRKGPASARAIIIDEVTVGVAVTIGDLSRLSSGLRIGQTTTVWVGKTPRLNIPVRNTGQTFLHAVGRVRCLSGGRSHSYRVVMSTVLPGESAVLPVNARGLQVGSASCAVRLRPSSGRLASWNGTVALASTTITKTYHPSKGVYVSLPEQTMPFWAVALMVLGGLILAVLVLVFVQRQRMTGRRSAEPGKAGALSAWFPRFGRADAK